MAKKVKHSDLAEENIWKDTIASTNELEAALKLADEQAKMLGESIKQGVGAIDTKTLGGIKKLNEQNAKTNAIFKQTLSNEKLKKQLNIEKIKAEKELIKIEQENEKTKQQKLKTAKEEIRLKQQEKRLTDQNNRSIEREENARIKAAKAIEKENSAYNKLSTQLNEARKRYKDLAAAGDENTKEGKELLAVVTELDTKLKDIDKSVGQSQRNVGNYTDTWNDLKGSLAESIQSGEGIKGVFATLRNGIIGATRAGLAFIATPIGAAIAALSAVGLAAREWFNYNEQVAEAVKVTDAITGLQGKAADNARIQAQVLADTYGGDFKKNLEVAQKLVQNFGISYEEALDTIEQGLIETGGQNDELLQSLNEYPVFFKKAGFSVEEFKNIVNTGFDLGIYDDKLPDAIKEFELAITEGTQTAKDALNNAFGEQFTGKLLNDVATGAITTKDALSLIAEETKKQGVNVQEAQQLTADLFKGAGEDAGGFLNIMEAVTIATSDQARELTDIQKIQKAEIESNKELALSRDEALKSDRFIEFSSIIKIAWNEIQIAFFNGVSAITEGVKLLYNEVSPIFEFFGRAFTPLVDLFRKMTGAGIDLRGSIDFVSTGFRIAITPLRLLINTVKQSISIFELLLNQGKKVANFFGSDFEIKSDSELFDNIKNTANKFGEIFSDVIVLNEDKELESLERIEKEREKALNKRKENEEKAAKEAAEKAREEYKEGFKKATESLKDSFKQVEVEFQDIFRDFKGEKPIIEVEVEVEDELTPEELLKEKKQDELVKKAAADKKKKEEQAEREKEELKRSIRNKTFEFTERLLERQTEKEAQLINENIEKANDEANKLRDLADKGVLGAKESLAQNLKDQAEAERQKEVLQKKAENREKNLAFLKGVTNAISEGKSNGEAITEAGLLIAAVEAFQLPSFFEGTEDTGTVANPLDSNGGRLAVLHNNERVFTAEQNSKLGGISNKEASDIIHNYNNGLILPKNNLEKSDNSSILLNGLKSVENAIKNIPKVNYHYDEVNRAMVEIIKTRERTVRNHRKTKGFL